MKVIVAGCRAFDDLPLMCRKMDAITKKAKEVVVLSDHTKGAAQYGEKWAFLRGHTYLVYYANAPRDWGPISQQMIAEADALVAFHNFIGTPDICTMLVAQARRAKLQVRVIDWE
jgi:hypothetical protein